MQIYVEEINVIYPKMFFHLSSTYLFGFVFFFIIKDVLILSFDIDRTVWIFLSSQIWICLPCFVSYMLLQLVTLCVSLYSNSRRGMGLLNVWKRSLKCLLPKVLYICKLQLHMWMLILSVNCLLSAKMHWAVTFYDKSFKI